MLKVEHISCGYDGDAVVHDISFEVQTNERLCILGPNGCGKTTLLRAITGMLPCTGRVLADGMDIHHTQRNQVARTIALMSQLTATYFSYTVYETVMLGRYVYQRDRGPFSGESSEDRRIVKESMERTGILQLKDKLITELSGGQLQRVFLARTFAQSPHIILLDEPTNHLDLKYQLELMEYLREWAKEDGRCVVGVLHDINLALSFADRLLLMQEGRVAAFGPVEGFDLSLISSIYGVDVGGYMRANLSRWQK